MNNNNLAAVQFSQSFLPRTIGCNINHDDGADADDDDDDDEYYGDEVDYHRDLKMRRQDDNDAPTFQHYCVLLMFQYFTQEFPSVLY